MGEFSGGRHRHGTASACPAGPRCPPAPGCPRRALAALPDALLALPDGLLAGLASYARHRPHAASLMLLFSR